MPYNALSKISCTIFPTNHPRLPPGLPCQEYKHYTAQSQSGALQELVIIESTIGTSFEIRVDIEPTSYSMLRRRPDDPDHIRREDDYLIYVVLDGVKVQRSKRHRLQNGPTRISGVYSEDRTKSRNFQFGKLALVDADDDALDPQARQKLAAELCEDDAVLQSLGTIEVNIVRCQLGKALPVPSRPTRGRAPSRSAVDLRTTNQMKFSERTKKACLSSTAGLSDAIPSGEGQTYGGKRHVKPIVWEDPNPFLQFVFKYKSKALLEAEGIIAPPPPPPPAPPAYAPRLPEPVQEPLKPKLKQDPVPQPSPQKHVCTCQSSHRSVTRAESVEDKKPKREYIEIDSDDDSKATRAGLSSQSPHKPSSAGDSKTAVKTESGGSGNVIHDSDGCDDHHDKDGDHGHRKTKSRKVSGSQVIDLTGDASDSD